MLVMGRLDVVVGAEHFASAEGDMSRNVWWSRVFEQMMLRKDVLINKLSTADITAEAMPLLVLLKSVFTDEDFVTDVTKKFVGRFVVVPQIVFSEENCAAHIASIAMSGFEVLSESRRTGEYSFANVAR